MPQSLNAKIVTLLGYCLAKKINYVTFDDPPYEPMLKAARDYFADVWSFDLFDDYFQRDLENHINNRKDAAYINNLISEIRAYLEANIETIFIVVPLTGAYIEKSITTGNVSVLATITNGDAVTPRRVPFANVINDIVDVTGISEIRVRRAIASITDHRAPDFLSCPLLVIKKVGQFTELTNYFRYILRHYNVFLRLLAVSNKEQSNRHTIWIDAKQFFAIGSRANYQHAPLYDIIEIPFNLNFLSNLDNQNILADIITIFESRTPDSLQIVYFRALKFFNYATDGHKHPFNDISFKILNILIAAETLLLFTTRGEKKKKLAHIMVGLANIPLANRQHYFDAVIEVYNDRSGFVHSGKQGLSKYQLDLETAALESNSFEFLNDMMLKILTSFPQWYFEIQSRTTSDKYFDYWKEKVARLVPSEKTSVWQRIGIWIIYFLKKIFGIHSEV